MAIREEPPLHHEAFHQQALKTPDAPAIRDVKRNTVFTYAQVQKKVLVLAQELRSVGATIETVVATYMEPSADYLIGLLAILTAGAAYVPMELAYPTPMIENVLKDANPVAILTTLGNKKRIPMTHAAIIAIDDTQHRDKETKSLAQLLDDYETQQKPTLDNLAFLVYSSGTTGQPKGIANPHRAPAISYEWRFSIKDYSEKDVVAANVFFVWEIFRPIMRGGCVVPIPNDVIFDAAALLDMLEEQQVTEMLFTPSLIENLLTTFPAQVVQEKMRSFDTVFLNGEVVTMKLRKRCLKVFPHVRFINLYSISECHEVGAIDLRDINPEFSPKFCPIGPPSHELVYILDEDQQVLPPGEAGELYVSGNMLARGYLNLPHLTESRFLPDPFQPGLTMYRTGDRARFLPNGHIEILGRCDFMVKIRGYSVVLGAVETGLIETVALSTCVVVADGDEGEDKHLVAYLVRATDLEESDTRLRQWTIDPRTGACPEIRRSVNGHLPHYCVPSVFIEVETLPVNQVGSKLDRKALQAQAADRRTMLRSLQYSTDTHATAHGCNSEEEQLQSAILRQLSKYLRIPQGAPLPDVEAAMLTLWQVVLDRDPGVLTVHSEFHEQGGHSLSAARLVALVNKVFGCKMSAMKLFRDNSTVQQLCQDVVESWAVHVSTDTEQHDMASTADSSDKEWSVVDAQDQEMQETILQQVRDDSILPVDLLIRKAQSVTTLDKARSVLLTGATGFLGVHVLVEILNTFPEATVICLIRSWDRDAIRKNIEKYRLAADLTRVVTIHGDLSLPSFGMNPADWNQTVGSVDAVIHCAAVVSLTAPYAALKSTNVDGTLTSIRLAAACKPGTPLVYVSSNGIFPTDMGSEEIFLENDDIACLPGRLGAFDGYGLSKWAAERLVGAASAAGLPTMTVRYGNISWHSKSGIGNPLDYQGLILNGCIRLGQRPEIDGWLFETTPVDIAANLLVKLANDSQSLDGGIYNCVQDGFTPAETVFDVYEVSTGRSVNVVKPLVWKRSIEDAVIGGDTNLAPLWAFISGIEWQRYLVTMAYLDCVRLDATVQRLGAPHRQDLITNEYFRVFFDRNKSLLGSPTSDDLSLSQPAAYTMSSNKAVPINPTVIGGPQGPLAGQVAVVTGASSGIGRGIAISLVQAGCHLALAARRIEELENTRSMIAEACPYSACKTILIQTDVTDRKQVQRLVKSTEGALGSIDIFVNNAGVMYFTLMKNVLWDQWERTVDVNCKGTMYGIGSVLPKMLARGKGHIVNITSDAGRKAMGGLGVYCGSKFFVEALSQSLRTETANSGLRVTCIQPGNVETPLLATSTDPEGLKQWGEPTGAKVLEPADIGRAVVYAVTQPEWCAVNEILVEPREEPA